MKKQLLGIVTMLFFFLSLPLWSQVGTAGLLNSTDGTIYFLALPVSLQEHHILMNNPSSFKDLIRRYVSDLVFLPPGGVYQQLPIYQDNTLVVGYVQRAGHRYRPLFNILISDSQTDAFFEIDQTDYISTPNGKVLVYSGWVDDPPALNRFLLDGMANDWQSIPDRVRFNREFIPLRIRQGSGSATRHISLNQSLFWGIGGTSLDRIRSYTEQNGQYWIVRTHHEILKGMSVFLYLYSEGNRQHPNAYTIEVSVTDGSGPVLLWNNKNTYAQIIGSYQKGDFFLEFFLEKDRLPDDIWNSLEREYFDLVSGFDDGGLFEDFLYGRMPAGGP